MVANTVQETLKDVHIDAIMRKADTGRPGRRGEPI